MTGPDPCQVAAAELATWTASALAIEEGKQVKSASTEENAACDRGGDVECARILARA